MDKHLRDMVLLLGSIGADRVKEVVQFISQTLEIAESLDNPQLGFQLLHKILGTIVEDTHHGWYDMMTENAPEFPLPFGRDPWLTDDLDLPDDWSYTGFIEAMKLNELFGGS